MPTDRHQTSDKRPTGSVYSSTDRSINKHQTSERCAQGCGSELKANEALLACRDKEADEFEEETNDKYLPRAKMSPQKRKKLN